MIVLGERKRVGKQLRLFYLEITGTSQNVGEGNGNPPQCSCLEYPMDGRAWWAAVHVVAKSRTQLSDFTFTFHLYALEKEMATCSSVLAWRIPGTGEPGGLPSVGLHRVRHDWSDLAAAARMCWEQIKQKLPARVSLGPASLHSNCLVSSLSGVPQRMGKALVTEALLSPSWPKGGGAWEAFLSLDLKNVESPGASVIRKRKK